MIIPFKNNTPDVSDAAFVAESAQIIGSVKMHEGSCVLFNSTVRGDNGLIEIGKYSNIQDGCTLHTSSAKEFSTMTIGDYVTVGHNAVLHGCTIGDGCLIGMGSIIMDGSVIGEHSIVGAGSLVTSGKTFPPYSLIMGSPAKVVKTITPERADTLLGYAEGYYQKALEYKKVLG